MSNKEMTNGQKALATPLGIIAGFLAITEIALTVTIVNTDGQAQILLTWFTILLTTAMVLGFFLILWNRPLHFYSPQDYGVATDIRSYAMALRGRVDVSGVDTMNNNEDSPANKGWRAMTRWLIQMARAANPHYLNYLLAVNGKMLSHSDHARVYNGLSRSDENRSFIDRLPIIGSGYDAARRRFFESYLLGFNSALAGTVLELEFQHEEYSMKVAVDSEAVDWINEEIGFA